MTAAHNFLISLLLCVCFQMRIICPLQYLCQWLQVFTHSTGLECVFFFVSIFCYIFYAVEIFSVWWHFDSVEFVYFLCKMFVVNRSKMPTVLWARKCTSNAGLVDSHIDQSIQICYSFIFLYLFGHSEYILHLLLCVMHFSFAPFDSFVNVSHRIQDK